ncbi:hypothetical protein GMC93_01825 [Streptococcus parasanguinis]|nr:hypothetical protein [Streptococcus parasanguinis]MTR98696.1 hypothetical protein [Streptococcus parasanguinis]
MGSPPRVRGKLWPRVIRQVCHGITPACAGKTILEQWAFQVFEDPPPRVRGKHESTSFFLQVFGITPACTGKTTNSGQMLQIA